MPSVRKNFVYSTLYQVLNIISPLLTAPYISRILGAEGVGIQSYTASVQYYFILFSALGTSSYGAREISRNRDDKQMRSKLFWEIELMTVGTSGISLVCWLILCIQPSRYQVFYFALIPRILASMLDISWFFHGLEEFRLTVARSSFFKILGIILLFLMIKSKEDLLLYIVITAVTAAASSLVCWFYLPRFIVRVPKKELSIWTHLPQTLIYFIPTIATSIYTVLDKTLIGIITKNETQNGYYEQAEKVINLAKSVAFTAINAVLEVRVSYLFVENKLEEIRTRIAETLNYILFMGFGCMFGIIGIAENFVPSFFGEGYDGVIELLYIFSPIIVIIGISNCLGSLYYTPAGKRAQSSRYLIVGSLLNLILNIILIPRLGAVGAAIASLLAEGTITVLYVYHSDGFMSWKLLGRSSWKKFLSGLIMLGIVYRIGRISFGNVEKLALQILMGVVLYCVLLIIMRDQWFTNLAISLWKKYGCRDKRE